MNKRISPSAFSLRLPEKSHLGDWAPQPCAFPALDEHFKEFSSAPFKNWPEHKKLEKINSVLIDLIQQTATPCFLLPCVLDFIDRINQKQIYLHYSLGSFELFLNEFCQLSPEQNYSIRAKIVGKSIPRERYQELFPVASGKLYAGSHFVTAHSSPDLDTTVASFWGWMDAFGCRVGDALHVWNVPGGPPEGQVEIAFLFQQMFGQGVFQYIAKSRSSLGVTGIDLMTQKGMLRKSAENSVRDVDHERTQNAVVLTDEQGYYVGDWRYFDVEGVQNIIVLFGNCLHWFSHSLQSTLIRLFGKAQLQVNDVRGEMKTFWDLRLEDCRPVKELTKKQNEYLQAFVDKVLHEEKGLKATFAAIAKSLEKIGVKEFQETHALLEAIANSGIFDSSGKLIEDRSKIFHVFEKAVSSLERAIDAISKYVDRLSVALNIKSQVLGHQPQSVSSRADIEEIRSKMDNYPYLTVTGSDSQGFLTPIGVVHASDLFKPILGTVTLRDFCNREETKIPSYLEVISVIDHHKSALQTSSAPVAIISNAQSSNSMVAELAFAINDRYSTGGMSQEEISMQIKEMVNSLTSASQKRIFQRLLQRQIIADREETFFVHPSREFAEYLHFLYAILDDTDLLTKVSMRDVECVASLINRLKSLTLGREVEVVHFDDLPRDDKFVAAAARRLLQNDELYSLYHKIYALKEEAVSANILLCSEGMPSTLFADTKVQNGCCRVGQTKMFAKNFPVFEPKADAIRAFWLKEAQNFQHERPDCDLHLHMISTLAGAEDLVHGKTDQFKHRDQIWLWIPPNESAVGHLKSFLNGFRSIAALQSPLTEVEFLGQNAKDLEQIFKESFLPVPTKTHAARGLPMAVLYFKAGSINSRKAQISPFLPKLG